MGSVCRVLWWLFAVLTCSAATPVVWDDFQIDGALVALELDRYEYEDKCNVMATAEWAWLKAGAPATGPLALRKRQTEQEFAAQKLAASKYVHQVWDADQSLPPQLIEEMDMEAHPGDELLNHNLYAQKLNYSYSVAALYESTRIPCFRNSAGCQMGIRDVRTVLAKSGDIAELLHTWRHWHNAVKEGADGFFHQLQLVREAAVANEAENPMSYWLHMQEMDTASSTELSYERAEEFWEEIKPLYTKLQQYVTRWLRHQLGDLGTEDTNIPAHVLGSLVGEDWSTLADLVLPPNDSTLKNLHKGLANEGYTGKHLYSLALMTLNITTNMGLQRLGEDIWNKFLFNGTCPPQTVKFCDNEGTLRVLTCGEVSWTEYLDAHEISTKALISHLTNDNNRHILRQSNRYSALMDAIPGMMSLIAASPERLKELNLFSKNSASENYEDYDEYDYSETRNPEVLLLMALRILPRLPYYLAADRWRLNMLNSTATNTSWSKYRKQYQMITVPNDEDDLSFLSDPYILSNRPYLVKFFATILQFQLLDYFVDPNFIDPLESVKSKDELGMLMQKSQSMKWPEVVQDKLNLNYLSTEPLLDYFKPLEKLLNKDVKKDDPKVVRPVVEFTTPRPTASLNMSADLIEEEPQDQPPSTAQPVISTESSVSKFEENVDLNNTVANTHTNLTEGQIPIKKGSTEVSTAILVASLVVFALAVTAGVLVAARRCYKRKYQRNRRPTTER